MQKACSSKAHSLYSATTPISSSWRHTAGLRTSLQPDRKHIPALWRPSLSLLPLRILPRGPGSSLKNSPRLRWHRGQSKSHRYQQTVGGFCGDVPTARLLSNYRSRQRLESQISPALYLLPVLVVGAYLLYGTLLPTPPELSEYSASEDPSRELAGAALESEMAVLPGRLGNLTPEQEEKLFELWKLIMQVGGITDDESTADASNSTSAPLQAPGSTATGESEKPKKKRLGIFKKKDKKDQKENAAQATEPSSSSMDGVKDDDPEDKYGQNKQFKETLANRSPESIRESFWSMVKMDHPDQLVLRFLRARKWDVQKALVMLVSTMKWRQDVHVDDVIMVEGEEQMLLQEKNGPSDKEKKFAQEFLAQMRLGKTFSHGVDKEGRPITVVRVRLHKASDQSNDSLERFTIYFIETARMLLQAPADTGTIVFDMTGFSLANMDYAPVKFMIQCFEANYPESLGAVLVHKAPWVFQGIWKVIRGWLDPVVASKVHFTNNVKDLSEYMDTAKIPKEMDGEDNWSYKYVEPVIGENDQMKDGATRDKLLEERAAMFEEYEQKTMQWIKGSETADKLAAKEERDAIAKKLRENYWTADPYVRSRSYYDRIGVLLPGGNLNFYPTEKSGSAANGASVTAAASAPAAAESGSAVTTSADDVD